MIRILIVDDSSTELAILKHIFSSVPDMEIVGIASNGKEAIALAEQLKPNIITMDILMPIMNGYEAIRHIMRTTPIPIVAISSHLNKSMADATYEALDAGALIVLDKPVNINSVKFQFEAKHLIDTVRSMSEIKVIRRRDFSESEKKKRKSNKEANSINKKIDIIAIGASVGGPHALKVILAQLPKEFRIPIVIVQHMIPGYIEGFTEWLNNNTALKIKNATDFEVLTGGTVYFAPDNYHLTVEQSQGELIAKLIKGPTVGGFCPSATVLFQSIAKSCKNKAIGVLLTGMGSDGAEGLLTLKNAKSHTFIQDEKSAVVFGMAGVAQSLGAVDTVIELDKIAEYLIHLTQ